MNARMQRLFWWFNFFFVIMFFVVGTVFAVLVQDVAFIKAHPLAFTMETVAWALLSSAPLLFYLYSRRRNHKIKVSKFMLQCGLAAAHLGVANVILEIGGVWDYFLRNYAS